MVFKCYLVYNISRIRIFGQKKTFRCPNVTFVYLNDKLPYYIKVESLKVSIALDLGSCIGDEAGYTIETTS